MDPRGTFLSFSCNFQENYPGSELIMRSMAVTSNVLSNLLVGGMGGMGYPQIHFLSVWIVKK